MECSVQLHFTKAIARGITGRTGATDDALGTSAIEAIAMVPTIPVNGDCTQKKILACGSRVSIVCKNCH